jgi:hypothetical protein
MDCGCRPLVVDVIGPVGPMPCDADCMAEGEEEEAG